MIAVRLSSVALNFMPDQVQRTIYQGKRRGAWAMFQARKNIIPLWHSVAIDVNIDRLVWIYSN